MEILKLRDGAIIRHNSSIKDRILYYKLTQMSGRPGFLSVHQIIGFFFNYEDANERDCPFSLNVHK